MKAFVLDASVAVQLALPDERSERAERFIERVGLDSELWVPAVWWCEVSNAIITAERRERLTEAEAMGALGLLRTLPLETDWTADFDSAWRLRSLGKEYGLAAYDAAYLELAERRELPLATVGRALAQAARKVGVETL